MLELADLSGTWDVDRMPLLRTQTVEHTQSYSLSNVALQQFSDGPHTTWTVY